ncbi:MAG: radical SAM protein [Anaerocolumna sp.]
MECILYLTDSCNLKCSYCYEGSSKNNSFLSSDNLDKALAFMVNNNIPGENIYLTFLGGEPLLNKQRIYEAMELINTKFRLWKNLFRYSITTNGILLDSQILELMVSNHFNLSVSVDGDKETYNLNRLSVNGEDVYPVILNKVMDLADRNIKFHIRMTVTANNVHLFYKNVLYFYNLGINSFHIAFDSFGDWNDKTLNELDKQLEQLDEFYLVTIAGQEEAIIDLYDYKYTTLLPKRTRKYCSAGTKSHITINSKGEIYPCGYVVNQEKWKLGTVTAGMEPYVFIQNVKASVNTISKCKDCEIAFTCKGTKCGFQNYSLSGYLNTPIECVCRLERLLYRHDMKVITELFKKKHPRIMTYYLEAVNHGIEISNPVKEILKAASVLI